MTIDTPDVPPTFATTTLYSSAVSLDARGDRALVDANARLLPGTRVLAGVGADAMADAQRAWLGSGSVPGRFSPYGEMVEQALLDLHVLSKDGAPAAGWSRKWRYVWPRDAAFVAAALARTDHLPEAEAALSLLQEVQEPDGRFQARYLLDGSGVPDARGYQLDGTGWALWGTAAVAETLPTADRRELVRGLMPLIERSSTALVRLTDDGTRLPPASSDYWEVPETTVTLGTAGPVLMGLEAASRLYEDLGRATDAEALEQAAHRLGAVIERTFGARGYPRHLDGDQVDAAVCFVLPPFVQTPPAGAVEVWRAAPGRMLRPAGGLAPGEGWKRDGVSWTPETALFALTAAHSGDVAAARHWLDWLNRHRTEHGALPEKVLHDGSPAAVAPLAWTAATVVLAVSALETAAPRR